MASLKEVDTQELIVQASVQLKQLPGIQKPEWAQFVKTGPSRERIPEKADWWWMRAASILRQVYLKKQGVSKMRKVYSGRKNRGHKPEHVFPGSGKIIRVLFKQLESEGFVKIEKGKGRVITPQGQKFLDAVAKGITSPAKESA